jgi:hypothetical protein
LSAIIQPEQPEGSSTTTGRDWQANAADATMTLRSDSSVIRAVCSMATTTYDENGIRFEYTPAWTMEVTDSGPLTTINLEHPAGVAFLIVTSDDSCPDPGEVADTILETLREEYAELEDEPFEEVVNKRLVSGYDVQFFALDLSNTARIRSFRTFTRTITVYGQWSDLVEDEASDLAETIIRSVEHSED